MNRHFPRPDRISQKPSVADDVFQRLGRQRTVRFAPVQVGPDAKLAENPFESVPATRSRRERLANVIRRVTSLRFAQVVKSEPEKPRQRGFGAATPRQERVARVEEQITTLRAKEVAKAEMQGVITGDVFEPVGSDGAFAGDLYSPLEQARQQAEHAGSSDDIERKLARLAMRQAFDSQMRPPAPAIPEGAEVTRDWFEPAA